MTIEQMLLGMVPAAAKLAVEAIVAMFKGKPELAARKAEEAGRRQKNKLETDAALALQKKLSKR